MEKNFVDMVIKKIVESRDGCKHECEYGEGHVFDTYCAKCGMSVRDYKFEDWIDLEDVLRATWTDDSVKKYLEVRTIDIPRDDIMGSRDSMIASIVYSWELGKTLREQSEETLKFLDSILPPSL